MRGNTVRLCSICKREYAVLEASTVTGADICVCEGCLETKAKTNFVWICLCCRRVYLRPKSLVIAACDEELREAYRGYLDTNLIQGLESCLACDPERTAQPARAS